MTIENLEGQLDELQRKLDEANSRHENLLRQSVKGQALLDKHQGPQLIAHWMTQDLRDGGIHEVNIFNNKLIIAIFFFKQINFTFSERYLQYSCQAIRQAIASANDN